jgi:hypothetical protein
VPPGPTVRPGPGTGQAPGTGAFFLIIEQVVGSGESAVWRVEPAPIPAGRSREQAREAALDLARTFRPKHPFSPQRRGIFRVHDDCYLVVVQGMTRTFHFRVNVTEQVF